MIKDVGLGLAEAFIKCTIHNDVKDPNILIFNINGKRVYKIGDYGGSVIYKKNLD